MKYISKIALLFLVAFGNTSFGMMHMLTRKSTQPRQYQQLSPQRRMMQTKALTTTVQSSPSFANRLQQKFNEFKATGRNVWAWLTGRPSQAPAINRPQAIALQPLAEPLTTSVETPSTTPTSSSTAMLQRIHRAELKTSENIAQEIAPVLKAIELSKENLPQKKETALMVCTPPGIENDYISAAESFDDIKNFIKALIIKILTDAGLNKEEINDILLQLNNDQKYIYENAYTIPNKPIFHDPTLDPNILQEIIIKLKNARINPLCINILNKPKNEMENGFAGALTPVRIKDHLLESPMLIFSQELINTETREYVGFAISHEIGHLILCHSNALHWIKKHITEILRKKNGLSESEKRTWILDGNTGKMIEEERDPLSIKIENTVNHTFKEIEALFELEADITYSLYDKNSAEGSLEAFQARISSGRFATATMSSDIHQSTNMKYHWLKRIRDLHKAQEAAKE